MFPGETVLSARNLGTPDDPHISEFKVMQSPGNRLFYIGTLWTNCGECPECVQPWLRKGQQDQGSRETDYFDTMQEADDALAIYKVSGVMPKMRT